MKFIRILKTNIKESILGVFRNFSLSIASISCITITLLLVGASIILTLNVNNFTTEIERDMTIVVFLEHKIDDENITRIKNNINEMNGIKSIVFNSKQSVKEEMQEESEIFKSVLENYTNDTNPLQDAFLVKVDEVESIGKIADKIEKIEGVDIVKYGEGSVEELVKIFNLVKKVMYIIVVALIVVTAFLISNTIKLSIDYRSREIEIRRLVGASNTFIRQPFFFEGIFLGFLGSILPIVGCCVGYNYFYNRMGGQIFTKIIKLVHPSELIYLIIIVLFVIGTLVGAFGSYRAVRKHLKI